MENENKTERIYKTSESVRASKKRWYENNKEHCKELSKQWRRDHPESRRAPNKRYQERHPDKIKEINTRYHKRQKSFKAGFKELSAIDISIF